jgi:hypothetical protein
MAGESSAEIIRLPRRTFRTTVPTRKLPEQFSLFGRVCLQIWPDKPITALAQEAGCSERAATFYITGERAPSHEALMAVLEQLRPRRRK